MLVVNSKGYFPMFPTPYLHQTTSLHPLTTAHLAVTMSLLELCAAELSQKIEAELANNPALELKEIQRCPICHRILIDAGLCPRCTLPKQLCSDEPIVFVSPRDDFHISKFNAENILTQKTRKTEFGSTEML